MEPNFAGEDFGEVNFKFTSFEKCTFKDCVLSGVDFNEIEIKKCRFDGC